MALQRSTDRFEVRQMRRLQQPLAWIGLVIVCSWSVMSAQTGTPEGEWRHNSNDLAASKYSPLDQITASNFSRLRIAWRWDSADAELMRSDAVGTWRAPADRVLDLLEKQDPKRWVSGSGAMQPPLRSRRPSTGSLRATPLMIGGLLYISTGLGQVAAVEARTGKTVWVFDPRAYEAGTPPPAAWTHRGVEYWSGEGGRILFGTNDGYLIALEAKTGEPVRTFGRSGRVDLMDGIPRAQRGKKDVLNLLPLRSISPPLVVRNTVIVGSTINDDTITKEAPPGWIRAYDVRTGRLKWDFHTVPQADEFGSDTWQKDSWAYSGDTNMWNMMSADEELGYVYVPVGSATSSYYGGHRPGDNLFADSLVCLDSETGKRVWHFQTVHHGMWDYEPISTPMLMDITVNGSRIKAVAQLNKNGFVYTFDRVTGRPVWPIEERPVPTDTDLQGEVPSPTQPFPTKPAALDYQGTSVDDLVDFTPEIRQMALEAVKGLRFGPLYTPPSMQGTLSRPGNVGGMNCCGSAFDPTTGTLYIPSRNGESVFRYRQALPGEPATLRYLADLRTIGPAFPGPTLPDGLPLWKPPYSRLTAINMNSGEHIWTVPLGNGDRIRNHPKLKSLNLPPLGGDGAIGNGPLLTKTLLLMPLTAGGTDDRPRLVAYDKATGKEVGSVDLPNTVRGVPMTYMLDGKQYIALTLAAPPDQVPQLVALTLP
jgi:quinoprotein glucose dehydrogenase